MSLSNEDVVDKGKIWKILDDNALADLTLLTSIAPLVVAKGNVMAFLKNASS